MRLLLAPRRLFSFGQKFDTNKDYYKVLGISSAATPEQIKKAYILLVKKHHPDKGTSSDAKIKEINEANEILSDSSLRKDYDAARKNFSSQNPFARSQAPPNSSRNPYSQVRNTSSSSSYSQGQGPFSQNRGPFSGQNIDDFFAEFMKSQGRPPNQGQRQGGRVFRDRFGNTYTVYESSSNSRQGQGDFWSEDPRRANRGAYDQRYYDQGGPYGQREGNFYSNDQNRQNSRSGFNNDQSIFDEYLKRAEALKNFRARQKPFSGKQNVRPPFYEEQEEPYMDEEEVKRNREWAKHKSEYERQKDEKEQRFSQDMANLANDFAESKQVFDREKQSKGFLGGLFAAGKHFFRKK